MRFPPWLRRRPEELGEEIESHLRMAIRDRVERGESPRQAEANARRELGNVGLIQEATRDVWGWRSIERLGQDLRFAGRTFRKTPGFTAVAVLTLALGIGANTAVFSLLWAVIVRPLPYESPDELVQIWEDPRGHGTEYNTVSAGVFRDWQENSQSFQHISALWMIEGNLTGTPEPERLHGAQVSADFFDLLRTQPNLGRTFLAEEGEPGQEQVVVLSHDLWTTRFGGASDVIGSTIHLNANSYTVIGVLPPEFHFHWRDAQYWIPFAFGAEDWHQGRQDHRLLVFARLGSDVSIEQATAEMNAAVEPLKPDYPIWKQDWGAVIVPFHDSVVANSGLTLLSLMGAIGFVLVIACVNVANLTFVRAARRGRELALRAAIGASRWRLIRQLLVESLSLASCGGVLGVLLAYSGRSLLVALCPPDFPRLHEVTVDRNVLAFSLAVSLLTGILCGLAPAWKASRPVLNRALKDGGAGWSAGTPRRASSSLVMLEVSLAFVLLVGAGLFFESFRRLASVDPGIDPANVLTLRFSLPESRYPTGERRAQFQRSMLDNIEALPGVESAGISTSFPFVTAANTGVRREGRPDSEFFLADYDFATPGYFEAIGIPLVRGRAFTAADETRTPRPVIVSEGFVRQSIPDADPIGVRYIGNGIPEVEVVGVVGDVSERHLAVPPAPHFYQPMATTNWTNFSLFVRTSGDPLLLALPVRKAILEADPNQPVTDIQTMESVISGSVAGPRLLMIVNGAFATAALLLAAMGIYGVMAYAVSARTREIGIRRALGAQHTELLGLILRQGMARILVGVALGFGGAFLLTRFVRSMLYGISPTDPATIAAVTGVLLGAALLACLLPAIRALQVDPTLALRYE